jgi:PAS domain S-box-containing protein
MTLEFWQSEESFRDTFRDMRVGMLLLSLDGRFLAANPAICEFLGYSEAELLNTNILAITHPADIALTRERMQQSLVELKSLPPFQKRYLRKNGQTVWGEVLISMVREADGSPKYRIGQIFDVTERRKNDQRLREYETVVEGLDAMIAVVDRDYHYVIANQAYLRYRNLRFEQLSQHLFPYPLDQEAFEAVVKKNFDECLQGKPVAFETKYTYPIIGERYLALSFSPIEGPEGIHRVALLMRDITEHKLAEAEVTKLSRRSAHLRDGERRKIARDLHDVTGQNLVVLETNLGSLGNTLPTTAKKLRKLAKSCQDLAQQCINEVRTLSYLSHPPLLDEAGLPDAISHFAHEFTKRTGIHVNLDASPDFGRMNPDVELALYKIAQESLTNVHRHSGSATAQVLLSRKGNEVTLEIHDDGRGKSRGSLKKGSARPFRPGGGISIMEERTNLIGGDLEISSGDGGTTVRVTVSGVAGGEQPALNANT